MNCGTDWDQNHFLNGCKLVFPSVRPSVLFSYIQLTGRNLMKFDALTSFHQRKNSIENGLVVRSFFYKSCYINYCIKRSGNATCRTILFFFVYLENIFH